MRESCAGMILSTAALFSALCACALALVYRAGFRFGFAAGYERARERINAIVDKLKARELFGDLLEDLERGEK